MRPDADEDARRRAGIGGRVAFVAAALAAAYSVIVLLERIGIPPGLINALGPGIALASLAGIGVAVGSMRVSRFFAAGWSMPPAYAGAAMLALAIGLFVLLVPRAMAASEIMIFCLAYTGGVAVAAFGVGPALRRRGATSLADFLGRRFPGRGVRWSVAAAIGTVGLLVALAGIEGAVRSLSASTGIGRWPALVLLAAVIAAIGVPGGLAGVVWAAAAAGGLTIAAFAVPIAISTFPSFHVPLPILGDSQAWAQASQRMATWLPDPYAASVPLDSAAALVLGIGVLAPLLLPAVSATDARKAGLTTLAAGVIVTALGLAAMALTTLALDAALLDRPPDRLPAWSYMASGRGYLTICGRAVRTPAAAKAACSGSTGFSGVLRPQDFQPEPAELLGGLAQASGLGIALAGAMGAAMTCLQAVAAAAGFFVVAAVVGHDGLSPRGRHRILASPRLAVTRSFHLALLIAATLILRVASISPHLMIALAADVSTAVVAPLLVLALIPKTNSAGAGIGLLFGAAAAAFVAGSRSGPFEAILDRGAVYAFVAVLAAGLVASLLVRRGPGRDHAGSKAGSQPTDAARLAGDRDRTLPEEKQSAPEAAGTMVRD